MSQGTAKTTIRCISITEGLCDIGTVKSAKFSRLMPRNWGEAADVDLEIINPWFELKVGDAFILAIEPMSEEEKARLLSMGMKDAA